MIKKYATMSGRASRAEYWWLRLFLLLLLGSIIGIGLLLDKDGKITLCIFAIFYLATLLPSLCVFVRRLHDRGISGTIFLWSFVIGIWGVMIIGNIINIFGSQDGDNEYGPNPNRKKQNQDIPIPETANQRNEIEDVNL